MLTAIADEIRQKSKLKGKLEERLALAKKFKEEGVNIELISRATGLLIDEISKL